MCTIHHHVAPEPQSIQGETSNVFACIRHRSHMSATSQYTRGDMLVQDICLREFKCACPLLVYPTHPNQHRIYLGSFSQYMSCTSRTKWMYEIVRTQHVCQKPSSIKPDISPEPQSIQKGTPCLNDPIRYRHHFKESTKYTHEVPGKCNMWTTASAAEMPITDITTCER